MSTLETGPVAELVERLMRLPTIGRKTAQRIAFYLLKAPAGDSHELADAIHGVDVLGHGVELVGGKGADYC